MLGRHAGRTGLGWFFGPPLEAAPALADFAGLDPGEAVYVCRVNDAGLRNGQWRALGVMPGFDRETWPIPRMSELVEVGSFGLVYDYGDDLAAEPAEERVELEAAQACPAVGLHLAGAVERALWRSLRA